MTLPPVALFALICGIWGTTWLAIAAGVAVLPPFLFAGSRFLTAGLILLAARRLLGRPVAPPRGEAPAGARGGLGLLVLSALFEPLAQLPLAALLDPAAVAGWLFLVIAGSLVAFTLYLRLLRDWGPLRTGLYAFVTPLIAVALGVLVQGERFGAGDAAGGLLMLAATWLCLTGTAPSAGQPADHRPGLADQGRDQVGRGQRPGQRRRLAGP